MACYEFSEVLKKISCAVVGVFDIFDLQNRVLKLCEDIFDAEACSLFLFDENNEWLRMVAALGYSAKFMNYPPIFKASEQIVEKPTTDEEKIGMTAWIASTGKPFMSNSTAEHKAHPHYRGVFDEKQFGPDGTIQLPEAK